MIKHVNNVEEFNEAIKEGKVLVDFYADWCGPCKMLAPVLEEVSEEVKDVLIVKVNVDDLGALAQKYRVQAIPTLILMENGANVNQSLGYKNKEELLSFLGK